MSTFKVFADPNPENPRIAWDNTGVMHCLHRRYTLGDEGAESPFKDGALQLRDDIVLAKPIYLYDHSGITVSHSPFSCPWDSGRVGTHYLTAEGLQAFTEGLDLSREEALAKADACLDDELRVYDAFLCGEVWCWTRFGDNGGDDETMGGCYGGYYGGSLEENGMLCDVLPEDREALKDAWDRRFE